jgi:hypothetical protein
MRRSTILSLPLQLVFPGLIPQKIHSWLHWSVDYYFFIEALIEIFIFQFYLLNHFLFVIID